MSDETLSFDRDKVAPGEHLASLATNLPLFTPVSITIGGIETLPVRCWARTTPLTASASYIDSVLVPQLPPGITIVELTVHTEQGDDVRVAEFVEITNIVTRPTDEVFADQIAAGQLVVVWRYDNATATWASYDPNAPAELNDLAWSPPATSSGWRSPLNVDDFQGGSSLVAGWNLISLE